MQINLLPKQSPLVTYLTIGSTALGALLLLANIWIGTSLLQKMQDQQSLEMQMQQLQAALPSIQAEATKAQKMQTLLAQYQALQRWSAARPAIGKDTARFSALLPKAGYLQAIQYKGDNVYEITAVLPDMESVSTYLHELKNSQGLTGVEIKQLIQATDLTNSTKSSQIPYKLNFEVARTSK